MLHILWMVIKFILILLGIILGLLLAIILLVLFCPVRYYASAEKLEEDFKKTKLHVSVSWLFHGVWVRLQFQEGTLGTKINLLGIPIHKILEKKKGSEKSDTFDELPDDLSEEDIDEFLERTVEEMPELPVNEASGDSEKNVAETAEPEKVDEAILELEDEKVDEAILELDEEVGEAILELEDEEVDEQSAESETCPDEEIEALEEVSDSQNEDKAVSFIEKIRNILDIVSGKLKSVGQSGSLAEKVADKVNVVKAKVQGILDKINWWKKFLTHPKVKDTVKCVKNALLKMLKHIIPTRLYGNITFGSEDPATTGTVLAVLGITMPFHKNCVEVTPLFEGKNVLTGKVQLKGRIYVGALLFQALKVIINRNVWFTIKYWKNKEES